MRNELLHHRVVVCSEDQGGTVCGVGVGTGEEELAALLSRPGQPEMFLPEGGSAIQVVIDQRVQKQEVHEAQLPTTLQSPEGKGRGPTKGKRRCLRRCS